MANKPVSSVYSIVEKAYYRLQAGDVLTHCVEDNSSEPIHEMIQEMVLAGPQSLDAIREILNETTKRKTQVHDDLNQVVNQLSIILKGYQINLETAQAIQVLQSMDEVQLIELLDAQDITESETRSGSLQVFTDSQELMATLNSKILLLDNIEQYLQDWLWGLTYQHIRQGEQDAGPNVITHGLQ